MKADNDLVYLGRRASDERRAALDSRNPAVREIHLELATAYEFRIHLLQKGTIETDPSAARRGLESAQRSKKSSISPAHTSDGPNSQEVILEIDRPSA